MNRKAKGQKRGQEERLRASQERSALIDLYRLIDRARGFVDPRVTVGFGWVHVR